MTKDSSVETVERSEGGTSSASGTMYEVQRIVQMYSDAGYATRVEQLFEKTISPTTRYRRRLRPMRLKVKELAALLDELDPELEVATEGCDCIGDAYGVELEGGVVMITRSGGKTVPRMIDDIRREDEERLERSRRYAQEEKERRAREMNMSMKDLERLLP